MVNARILLKRAYYEILWQREPAFRDAYRALLGLPESDLPAGIDRFRREWKLPADAWRDVLPALRKGDSGTDDACPFLSVDATVIPRKAQELSEPPPDVPQGSTLPAYDPDAYDSFEQYLQALQQAFRGLESPTLQEREYLQAWTRFSKQARCIPHYPDPPLSRILPYMPDAESREHYIRYALRWADSWEPAYWVPYGYGAWLSEGERRELARLALEGYCRQVEAQAKCKRVRLRREQGRELTWEQAQAWAEWLYLRHHKLLTWGQIVSQTVQRYGRVVPQEGEQEKAPQGAQAGKQEKDPPPPRRVLSRSRVEQAVKRAAAILGLGF